MQIAPEVASRKEPYRVGRWGSGRSRATGPISWIERIWSSVADRGQVYADVLKPGDDNISRNLTHDYARALLTARGDASGAAVSRELLNVMTRLSEAEELSFCRFLSENFHPEPDALRAAAERYLANSTPKQAAQLAAAAEPERLELLRRMNMARGGTAALVAMRKTILSHLAENPELAPLDSDLRHLFTSWFNRGFLELRQIGWQTPAAILEKLIAYEAVHAIDGWEDLRRRLAPDRRCFGFFHPALPAEPLIFVEVALTTGLAASIQPLLDRTDDDALQRESERTADTAIFYSISNCQDGLRGVSLGNFLIKQVVEELQIELPHLVRFSTLSPIPGFRRWLEQRLQSETPEIFLREDEVAALRASTAHVSSPSASASLAAALQTETWWQDPALADALRGPLIRLCASYLVTLSSRRLPLDPVARFHLSNGARLERVNWQGNLSPRGYQESYGIMVNYLYDPDEIEANHETLARGAVVRSAAVDAILGTPRAIKALLPSNRSRRLSSQ